jgi:spore coat protein U-like protein
MALKSAGSPADVVAYTLVCAGDTDGLGHFTGAGFNTPKAIGMSIKVLAANAQAAVAHPDYSDTVTMTISY